MNQQPERVRPELEQLERVIEGLLRAWMFADDDVVVVVRRRVEQLLHGAPVPEREAIERALGRLERARLQARLRMRDRG